jgi:hypothetical protein
MRFERRLLLTFAGGILGLTLWAIPQTAFAAWNQPGGAPPLNRDAARSSLGPSLAAIEGVPYVAWREHDGTNNELRVSRLNAAGDGWEPVGEVLNPASPINRSSTRSVFETAITSIGGVPYVAFNEVDAGMVAQLRVSRLNAQGTGWEAVGEATDPASPINNDPTIRADRVGIASIAGVPYVTWRETDDAILPDVSKIRVSRLSPDGLSWTQVVGGTTPINRSTTQSGDYPSLASVGGIPHVSWVECDAGDCTGNHETRVARYDSGSNTWVEIAGSPSPINQSVNGDSNYSSLTSIGGVPYVAWAETDGPGTNSEIRVARLNGAGTAWDKVGQASDPASPINRSGTNNASFTSLAAIGGVPYVAWTECDASNCSGNYQIRVARLNDAGSGWDEVVGGTSPINFSPGETALDPKLSSIAGVPYLAWREECPGCNDDYRIRAGRLEPDFRGQSETVGDTGATLTTNVRTYGVPYPIAFQYGAGAGLGTQTVATSAQSGNAGSASLSQPIGGLTPGGTYSWRAIGTDGTHATGASSTRTFATKDTAAPDLTASLTNKRFRLAGDETPVSARRKRTPRGTTFKYTLSEAAKLRITIERATKGRSVKGKCRRQTKRNKAKRRCTLYKRAGTLTRSGNAGSSKARFSGRIGRKALKRARYRAKLQATDAAGNVSKTRALAFAIVKR